MMTTLKAMIDMLKAVLVDFDGTLVDTVPALWKCYRLFLIRHGIDGNQEEFTSLMGPPIAEIVGILKQKYQLTESIDTLVQDYQDIVSAAYASQAVLFPWAENALAQLKARGVIVAIVTAAHSSFVTNVLQHHGITDLFDAIFGSQIGEPSKPDPAVYKRALIAFKLEPEEAVAIEDSPRGIESACRAGIATIAFDPEIAESVPLPNSERAFYRAANWQDIHKILNKFIQ